MHFLDTLIYVIFLSLFLGLFVLKQNRKNIQNISFSFICFGIALWVGGIYLLQMTKQFYWPDKMSLFGAIVMAGGFYSFSTVFPSERKLKRFQLHLLPLVFLIALLPFNLFIKNIVITADGFMPKNGPLFPLFALVCAVYVLATLKNFYYQFKNNIGYKRQRMMYVIFSLSIFLLIGTITDILLPAFGLASWKFIGPLSSVIFLALSSWSLVSFNLMDIRLVLKTVLVNTISLILVAVALAQTYDSSLLKSFNNNQAATIIIFAALALFVILRETFNWIFVKFFLKSYQVFKDSFDELNIFLHEEVGSERIILLGNKYFKKGLQLSWVYYCDVANNRIVFAPNESPFDQGKITLQQALNPQLAEYMKTTRSIKLLFGSEFEAFPRAANAPIAILPLWNKGELRGYFMLGPQMTLNGLSFEETQRLQYSWAHMETAFDRALLYEGLEQKVKAQVEDIEYKNKTLKELLQSRLDFIQVTSHQLRTPLAALSGALQILFDKQGDPAQHREMLEVASEKAKHLSKIITGTLKIARLDKPGNPEALSEYVNLNEIFAGLLPIVEAAGRAKEVIIDYDPIAKPEVMGNKLYLEQAFFNILENAVQQTEKGRIRIHFKEDNSTITTCVSDSGPGIDPEIRDRVFNRNVFGSNSEGLGLGLYIVKTIVEEHPGGKVWFETDSNGTTFFVQLRRFHKS